MAANPNPLKPAEIKALGLKRHPPGPPKAGEPEEPEEPEVPVTPWSWCDYAWAMFWRAWWNWHNVLGFDALSYKVGTRALTRINEIQAWKGLERAIWMVNALCPGQLPPQLADLSGAPVAVRGILTDT